MKNNAVSSFLNIFFFLLMIYLLTVYCKKQISQLAQHANVCHTLFNPSLLILLCLFSFGESKTLRISCLCNILSFYKTLLLIYENRDAIFLLGIVQNIVLHPTQKSSSFCPSGNLVSNRGTIQEFILHFTRSHKTFHGQQHDGKNKQQNYILKI